MEQKMADLPRDRVTPSPAFTHCAVDYSGPFYVKEGRKELKRYGVLFTCLKTQAIHLEVTHSLETDSYINALRRFVCRRGPVSQMRSDQGTNLVGEKRELKDALLEMDNKKVQVKMLKLNCDWFETKLNVPSASHIRTVRSVLSALLETNGRQLNDEALRTFMCEAEAVVNSRPLTADNLTSADTVEALTPIHLLTGKTKVVLPPPGSFQKADKYAKKLWRRVQHLTYLLSALLETNGRQLNDEALRTFMCEAEAVVNSRPLTADNLTSADTVEALTPIHLLTGKSKVVLPPPGSFQKADKYAKKLWRLVQHLTNEFWNRWKQEFLHSLQARQKWIRPRRNLEQDDIVLIKDDNVPRNNWRLARVIKVIQDGDKLVHRVSVAVGDPNLTSKGKRLGTTTVLERPVQKLVLLMSTSDR